MIRRWQEELGRTIVNLLPTLVLATGMVGMLIYSVDQAGWVRDSRPIDRLLLWGAVLGWMLAASRWRGWVVFVYTLLVGAFLAIQELASVAPSLDTWLKTSYPIQVDGMHLRLVTFQLRFTGWLAALQNGGTIRDTGLFVLVISLAAWIGTVWMFWWLVRRKQALPGILPLFALMAVNVHLSRQPRSTLVIFAAFAILAIVRTAFTALHWDWNRRRVDYSDELGGDWGLSGALLVVGLAAFAWFFSIVGTPDGWSLVSDLVEKSRQEMSDTANQLFGGVKPPPTPLPGEKPLQPPAAVSLPNLGEIGSPIAQGDQAIFWVGLSDPPPPPEELSGVQRGSYAIIRHYWRSAIYAAYSGRGWEAAPLDSQSADTELAPQPQNGRYLLRQHFEVDARHDLALFSVNDPVDVSGSLRLRQTQGDGSRLVEGRTSVYDVTSQATDVTVRQMETAPRLYPDAIRALYLSLPASLPARVTRLAHEIAGAGGNPYQKAVKVQEYLRQTYEYHLDVPLPPAGRDVVDYFLFDAPGGFCTYYASAMAVMLRVEGVPARVVSGYAMGNFDQRKGMYRVPASASHAWVEVYFTGLGWVEFEPTPAYAQFGYASGVYMGGDAQPLVPTPVKQPAGKGYNQLLWLLAPVGLVALLWSMYFWVRSERARLADPGAMARVLYRRVRRGLALAGAPLSPTLTAAEYIAEIGPSLEEYPRLGEVLRQATRLFEQAVYSPRQPKVEDVTEGEWMWGQARGELISLVLRVRLRR